MGMRQFIVSYDLHSPGQKYAKLKDALELNSAASKILESTYLISTNDQADEDWILKQLDVALDENDIVAVIEISNPSVIFRGNYGSYEILTNTSSE